MTQSGGRGFDRARFFLRLAGRGLRVIGHEKPNMTVLTEMFVDISPLPAFRLAQTTGAAIRSRDDRAAPWGGRQPAGCPEGKGLGRYRGGDGTSRVTGKWYRIVDAA